MRDNFRKQIAQITVSLLPIIFGKILRGQNLPNSSRPDGITYHVLGMLQSKGKLSPSEIGKMQHISRPNMTTLIDRMEKEQLVKRCQDPSDRRKIQIVITAQGEKRLLDAMTLLSERISKNLLAYSDEDLHKIRDALQTIGAIINKYPHQAVQKD